MRLNASMVTRVLTILQILSPEPYQLTSTMPLAWYSFVRHSTERSSTRVCIVGRFSPGANMRAYAESCHGQKIGRVTMRVHAIVLNDAE